MMRGAIFKQQRDTMAETDAGVAIARSDLGNCCVCFAVGDLKSGGVILPPRPRRHSEKRPVVPAFNDACPRLGNRARFIDLRDHAVLPTLSIFGILPVSRGTATPAPTLHLSRSEER